MAPLISDKMLLDSITGVQNQLGGIAQQFKNIESKLDDQNKDVAERFGHTDHEIKQIQNLMTGGQTPGNGLVVKVDRLENRLSERNERMHQIENLLLSVDRLNEIEKRRAWTIKAITTAVIGIIISLIYDRLKKP